MRNQDLDTLVDESRRRYHRASEAALARLLSLPIAKRMALPPAAMASMKPEHAAEFNRRLKADIYSLGQHDHWAAVVGRWMGVVTSRWQAAHAAVIGLAQGALDVPSSAAGVVADGAIAAVEGVLRAGQWLLWWAVPLALSIPASSLLGRLSAPWFASPGWSEFASDLGPAAVWLVTLTMGALIGRPLVRSLKACAVLEAATTAWELWKAVSQGASLSGYTWVLAALSVMLWLWSISAAGQPDDQE